MGRKLLFLNLFLFAILLPTSVMAQCPSSVSISASPGTIICSGTSVTFSASTTGGTGLSYEWFIGTTSQSATGSTFTTTTLNNSDKVKVIVTSSDEASCTATSNILTMTVNSVLTPSVSISASQTTICPGDNITYNASPINGGNNPSYNWKVDGSSVQNGSSSTFSSTALTNGQSVTVDLTSNATCASTTPVSSSPIVITVKPGTPATPGTISGQDTVCPGISSLTYTIAAVANATSYIWTLPSGWSGTSTTNSISATSGNTGSGTISVKALNDCGTSAAQTFTVNVLDGTPNTPGTISGDVQVCPGLSKTYSIAAVSGATEYEWTLPSGWSGSSTTNSIDVTTGASGNGNITVKAKNSCGTSSAKILAVSVKPGTPAVPTTISGTANICPGTTNTYSIAAVANATSYEWILPTGWTGSSSTTSINATSNSSGGNITVKATNDCGTSAIQSLTITMKPGTPATPIGISGSNDVCPNTSETYSVTNNSNVSEYIWTLPNGWTGTSSTSTITVNTGTSGSGNITVKAKNDCGTSAVAATIAVSIKAPAPVMSGTISGPATVCSSATGQTYTIPAIPNATKYIWTLPNGWSGNSTTNSITATAGSSGNISVFAENSCGKSASASFAVTSITGKPQQPGVITVTNLPTGAICPPASNIGFSVAGVSGLKYNWILPTGFEITSGAGTRSITVNVTATTPYSNNLKVEVNAENVCGKSSVRIYEPISVGNFVVTNAGPDQTVCSIISPINIIGDYNFSGSNKNLSTQWTSSNGGNFGNSSKLETTYTPSQAAINAGKTTLTLTTASPSGACGPGKDEMIIFFKPDPTANITGTSTICTGNATDITFNGTPNSIVTYKKNSGTDQTIAIGASGTATLNTGALTANTTYSLVSVKNATTPDCSIAVTESAVVTITKKPTAFINYGSSPYNKCITTEQPVTLTGTEAYTNGTYSAPAGLSINNSTGAITPSSSTAGTYTVTYETLASGGCEKVSTTTQVIIEDIPTITLNYSGTPFCSDGISSPLPTLGGTGKYQGGSFSSDKSGLVINATSGAINIAASTPGSYNVTYSITPSTGCAPVTQLTPVVITERPQPIISYTATAFCRSLSNAQPVNLTQSGTAVITGGTYSSLPSGLNIDASTGAINPSLSNAGDYTIKYTLTAANGCEAVFTETTLSITEIPSAEISYAGPFCQSNSNPQPVTFSNAVGEYENGVFSGDAGLTINPSTGAITASTSQSGTRTVTYKIPASGGCAEVIISTEVIITKVPTATITYNGPFCSSETNPQAVTYSNTVGAYQNGEFSGTNGLSIAADGSINPSTSTQGIHTVTYKILSANGCEDVISTTDIEIFEQVAITTQPSNLGICSTQAASFEVVASGDNLSYEWKRTDGAAITNATGENTSKLSFSNATSTNAGEYYVEVYGNAACSSIATSETVTLNIDENIIIIEPDEDEVFCDQEKENVTFEFIAHANGAPLEFTWLKDGVELNLISGKYEASVSIPVSPDVNYTGSLNIIDPNPNDNGVYAVRIKGPDYFTCSDATSKTYTLNVSPLPPNPTTAGEVFYCQEETAVALAATGESGATFKWYGSEDGDDLITDLIPNTEISGTTSYWVSQTTTNCESKRTELKITVKEKPAVPTTTSTLSFCLNEVVNGPLQAEGDSGNTINWYGAVDSSSPLESAPTPVTSSDVTTNYWVSQTKDGCESDRVQITITVNPLPILTVDADDSTICSGSSTKLNAAGATTYLWTVDGVAIQPTVESTKASPIVSPTTTTTYLVTGTSDKGCTSIAEVTINVDEPTVPGTLTGPESVCASSPNGTLTLSGYTGEIQRWERSNDAGANWTEIATTSATYEFTGLTTSTSFRAFVKSGVCDALSSNQVNIAIDPLPVGGELNFAGVGRIFMICENADPGYAVNLNLTGITGEVTAWQYRASSSTTWNTINNHTGLSLSASQIEALNISETTVFQVIISSGICTQNAYSKTAILSVIPTDITPTPVTVDPGVVCLGAPVTLSSETGYTQGSIISEGGDFDNAGIISDGWRFKNKKDPSDTGFDTDANNIQPDRWKRATPHPFTTANLNGPSPYSTSLKTWGSGIEDGNKGFAIVSSNNEATMETPVFSIGSTDQAILTFDQAYNLTPGASIMVEISTDGGNTYNTVLYSLSPTQENLGITSGHLADFGLGTKQDRPENKIEVDLGNYLGSNNLRIKFTYIGKRIGDVWAVDNIKIPEGPKGIVMEWNDYTDPDAPIFIGNNNSEQYIPKLIGLNTFEVKSKLVFDSEGNACEIAENAETIDVFVFDTYTSTATATGGVCGDSNIVLNGEISSVNQGVITTFPTLDGYETGAWEVVGPSGYTFSEAHFTSVNGISPATKDPNAIFNPGVSGNYSLTWTMVPTAKDPAGNLYANPGCPPVYTPVTFEIEDCTTLDFDGFDDYVDLGTSYAGNNSVEAWIRPEATTGTIFSTPSFEIKMSDLPGTVSPDGRWYHVAVSNGILYVDGIENGVAGSGKGGSKTLIGASWNDTSGGPENYFSGWIEELRIWKKPITQAQIQFMMNQHLQNAANMGVEIPMPVPGGLVYADLAGYYRLISKNPDPANIVTFAATLLPANGITPDLAINSVPGKLSNMTTNQENTAPMPYMSASDGTWADNNIWARPLVWDSPNSDGINGSTPIDWNIVRISHNINSGGKDITVLGLISDTAGKTLRIADPNGAQDETNAGQFLRVTHYLKLDGNIDLVGESQLLQDEGSLLAESSAGYLERDQQGTLSSFNYNYWTAPVSTQGSSNNSGFTVSDIMWDGTDSNNPKTINYLPDHAAADGAKTNPITKSNYWLFKFDNKLADDYDSWQHIGSTGFLKAGEGHTMKGVSGVGGTAAINQKQNYVYRGKPNNGTITLNIDKEKNYLVGNPYPSAIDSKKFILDNLNSTNVSGATNTKNVFDGTIYLWDHFSGATHILREYIGGYAVLNLTGGAPAIATDDRINSTAGVSTKTPKQFIPISQGFFVNTGTEENISGGVAFTLDGGAITFKNSQRIFSRETSGNSIFLKPETVVKTGKEEAKSTTSKIRISFKSPKGYLRQLLVGADANTTNGFDLGYDAPMIEYNLEDMYWLQGGNFLVIQGVPDFGKDQVLPIGVRIEKAGEFKIKLDTLENMSDDHTIYLKDIVLDTIHDLRAGPYTSTSEPGEITNRFQLIFYKEQATPDPIVVEEPIVDDFSEISLLHSYSENEMMVLNPQKLEISMIHLFDLNGKLLEIFDEVPSEAEIRLKVSNYSEGIYILKMHTDEEIITRKIIIKK